MIIVDEAADSELVQALRGLTEVNEQYCLRLHPIDGDAKHVRQTIIALAQEYLPGAGLYFCDDEEIFLLTRATSLRECKKAMFAIATAFKIQPAERVGELYDLTLQLTPLLTHLEKKIRSRHDAEQATARQHAKEQAAALAARKRQQILEQSVRKNAEQIQMQRKQRGEPVLMMIEDDPFSRRLVENVLQKQYRLNSLDSAEEALTYYAELAPDLLLLDINLPDVTGHELLEKIIALDPQAYVVMLSGNADKANIMQAMQRGAVGFVAKPFSRDRLFQYIERCPTISQEKAL